MAAETSSRVLIPYLSLFTVVIVVMAIFLTPGPSPVPGLTLLIHYRTYFPALNPILTIMSLMLSLTLVRTQAAVLLVLRIIWLTHPSAGLRLGGDLDLHCQRASYDPRCRTHRNVNVNPDKVII